MIPKNHKFFIKPTAEKLEIKEDLVADVVGHYYGEVRKMLNEMHSPNIALANLGNFKVKAHNLNKLIEKLELQAGYLENPTSFNQMSAKKGVEANLEGAKKLHESLQEERDKKKKIYEERYKKDLGE